VRLDSECVIGNAFNDFFSTVAEDLNRDIPESDNISPCSLITPQPNSFYLYPVDRDECLNIISNLKNKGSNLYNVPVGLLKAVKHILALPIANLINCSFESGIFPDDLKSACITPV
jgi:hypothetical protein